MTLFITGLLNIDVPMKFLGQGGIMDVGRELVIWACWHFPYNGMIQIPARAIGKEPPICSMTETIAVI